MKIKPLLDAVKFDTDGLITAVVQDHNTQEVLMVAYMNEETLKRTLETGIMTYWSRSRHEVWVKGQTSGNLQSVQEVRLDCDGDAVLFLVSQKGAACHTGYYSCFYRVLQSGQLVETGERQFDPTDVYGQE